jgi:hypothetical protein
MGFGYRSGIGEFIYALVTCHPDISYAVVHCAQNSVYPAKIHYHTIKHILKYLCLTKDDGLHYWRTSPNDCLPATDPPSINSTGHDLLLDGCPIHDALNLHGFVDSDWATCPKTHCSFTGVCIHLAGGTSAYKSKIQPTVAQLSTEAEFIGISDFGRLILFKRSVLWDVGVSHAAASILYEDNNACIAMVMVQKPILRMCHMDIKFHALVEWVKHDVLCLECIDTSLNMGNHFTKQLGHTLFHNHVNYILGKYHLHTAPSLPGSGPPSTNHSCQSLLLLRQTYPPLLQNYPANLLQLPHIYVLLGLTFLAPHFGGNRDFFRFRIFSLFIVYVKVYLTFFIPCVAQATSVFLRLVGGVLDIDT